jgi:copper transport protein
MTGGGRVMTVRARRWPRAGRIAAGVLAMLAGLPAAASAHAVLETSNPGWGAILRAAPRQITLGYDEDVVPQLARVAVVNGSGQDLAGAPQVAGNAVVVPLRSGPRGSYTVRWRMVASDDGHVTQGAFSFGVGAKPLPPVAASGANIAVAPELLAWLQFVGVVLAGGTLVFRALVSAPAARALRRPDDREALVALWVAVVGATVALHAGLFGFLVGVDPIVGGGLLNVVNTQIIPIRVGTHLGQAWTITTFAWLGVLTLLISAWAYPRRRERLLTAAGLASLCIAFGISWASHPASRGTLALAADYLHLLAGALWTGGLVSLAILAGVARRRSRTEREALFRACLLRFSKLALPIVALLAVAGAYVALRELPGPSAVIETGYGIELFLKSLVFLGALGLGAYHRRSVVPRIAAGAPAASVRRTLALEVGFLLVALALAATLGQTAPPR